MDEKERGVVHYKAVEEIFDNPSLVLAEAFTGLFSPESNVKYSLAKIFQAATQGKFSRQFAEEFTQFRKKGKIKDNHLGNNARLSLNELLKFFEEDSPDEEKFIAMKSIFFHAVAKETSESDELFLYHLIKICAQLNGTELLVLRKLYDYNLRADTREVGSQYPSIRTWISEIAKDLGLAHPVLLKGSLENLVNLDLIESPFANSPGSLVPSRKLLTDLGKDLVKYIINKQEQ